MARGGPRHTELLAKLGPPDELEAAYDAGRKPPPVSPRMPRSNVERWLHAQARIDARDHAAAIATIDAILASGYDQHDVVLIEPAKIAARVAEPMDFAGQAAGSAQAHR